MAQRREDRELAIIKAKKRMLGNIRFVGELYKIPKMLQDKVMHACIQKLLNATNKDDEDVLLIDAHKMPVLREVAPVTANDEESIEALCKLLMTIGRKLEEDAQLDAYKSALMRKYLTRLMAVAENRALPSRMRFMVQDLLEMRLNGYTPRRKEDKQMTQEEMRRLIDYEDGGKGKGKGKGGPVPPPPAQVLRRDGKGEGKGGAMGPAGYGAAGRGQGPAAPSGPTPALAGPHGSHGHPHGAGSLPKPAPVGAAPHSPAEVPVRSPAELKQMTAVLVRVR